LNDSSWPAFCLLEFGQFLVNINTHGIIIPLQKIYNLEAPRTDIKTIGKYTINSKEYLFQTLSGAFL